MTIAKTEMTVLNAAYNVSATCWRTLPAPSFEGSDVGRDSVGAEDEGGYRTKTTLGTRLRRAS